MAALDSGSSIWLYNMPTFTPADIAFVQECMKNPRVKWIKDSSGKLIDFQKLLWFKQERPDFEIYIGSEPIAAELTEEELAITEWVIAGNGNIDPELLAQYIQKPKEFAHARQELHDSIHVLGRVDDDSSHQWSIRNHIHWIKLRASQIVTGIEGKHVVMYSERRGLFTPYSE